MHRSLQALAAILAVCALGTAVAEEEPSARTPTGPYEQEGTLYPGLASVPWHAAASPCGRWLAVVEGHTANLLAVFDARTLEEVWRTSPAAQPASHRPVFTTDGERLILLEGDHLVVRRRSADGAWGIERRVALGFRPGITARNRSLVLAPDAASALFVDDGRVHQVSLDARTPRVVTLEGQGAVAVHVLDGRVAVSEWTDERAATTLLPSATTEEPEVLPFAVLAVGGDGKTWLVARAPRVRKAGDLSLTLVDASTRASLGPVPIREDAGRGWAFLTTAVFSPDGRYLATVESLRRGSIRDARSGRLLQEIDLYVGDRMIDLAFDATGRHLVTAGRRSGGEREDACVLVWRRRDGD